MTLASELSRLVGNRLHREIAAEIGVSRSAVGQWITGASVPSLANLVRLLDVLQINDVEQRDQLVRLAAAYEPANSATTTEPADSPVGAAAT